MFPVFVKVYKLALPTGTRFLFSKFFMAFILVERRIQATKIWLCLIWFHGLQIFSNAEWFLYGFAQQIVLKFSV